jgi:hypothetical protein
MAAPTAPVLGFNGKLYYNSGTYASPTWVLIDNVGDIEVTDATEKVEIPIRRNGGFKAYVQGLTDYGLAFKMVYDPADAAQSAIRNAKINRTPIEFLVLDQAVATAGSSGIRATMSVFKCARTEPLSGPMMAEVELAPTYAANPPSVFTAA